MSILSPYEQYLKNINRYEKPKKQINEAIAVSLNTRQVKRILADKLRVLAATIENMYVAVRDSESEYGDVLSANPSVIGGPSEYQKKQEKIAKAHEAEIKSLMSDIDAFEAKIKGCCDSLIKAERKINK